MRMPRLAEMVLGLAAGIALGLRWGPGQVLALAAGVAAAAALLLRPAGRTLVVAGAAVVGWTLGAAAARQAGADCRMRLPDGAALGVEGAFEALPWPGASAPFRLSPVRAGTRTLACTGTIRVKPGEGVRVPPAGEAVVGQGTWWVQPPEGRWPRPAERAGVLTLDSLRLAPADAAVSGPGPGPGPNDDRASAGFAGHPLLRARGRSQALVRELFGRRAGLAESLVLAQTGGLDTETRDRFAASGLSHILSISGLHVGLVAAAMLLLARALRLPARPATLGAAGATMAYVLFLGAPVPALRSCLQLGLLLGSRMLQRPADGRALLAACALVVLVLSPLSLLDPGFQLSFGGVLGLLLLRRPLLPWVARLPSKWLRESVATSLAATFATAPIAAVHFGRVAPVGVLANLLGVPVAGLAVPAIALALGVGAAAPGLGHFLAGGATLLLDALDLVARAAAGLPGGHALVPADQALAWALAAVAAAAVAAAAHRSPGAMGGAAHTAAAGISGSGSGSGSKSNRRARWMALGTASALLLLWPVALGVAGAGRVEIWAIDVGQGDAIAIRSPGNRWVLVDAGPRDERFDAGRARVVPFLLAHGARRLDALVITHADADHIGGAPAVLESLPVAQVIDPGLALGRPLYLQTLRAARARGARWLAARDGRELALDGMVLHFLAPRAAVLDSTREVNELCVVFSLEYGGFRALFMGDAPVVAEAALLREHDAGALRADVLKVGHHGSATSTGEALLEAARPRVALVSVGRHNRFGHPTPGTLRRLTRRGVRIYRTDEQGSVKVVAAGAGAWKVETSR